MWSCCAHTHQEPQHAQKSQQAGHQTMLSTLLGKAHVLYDVAGPRRVLCSCSNCWAFALQSLTLLFVSFVSSAHLAKEVLPVSLVLDSDNSLHDTDYRHLRFCWSGHYHNFSTSFLQAVRWRSQIQQSTHGHDFCLGKSDPCLPGPWSPPLSNSWCTLQPSFTACVCPALWQAISF